MEATSKVISSACRPLREPPARPAISGHHRGSIPGDPRHVLVALDFASPTRPDVYKLDVYSGDRILVERNPGTFYRWMADRAGEVRIGIGWSGTVVRVIVKPPGSRDWRTLTEYDAAHVLKTSDAMSPAGFDGDPRFLYVRAEHRGRKAIFRLDLLTQPFQRKLIAADPQYDIDGSLIYSPWLRKVVGAHYDADETKFIYWNEEAQRLQRRIDKALPERANVIANSSDDGKRHVVISENSAQPPAIYVVDDELGTKEMPAETYPHLKPRQLATPRQVSFKSRDGWQLQGFLTSPQGRPPKAMPTILFPHGGPASRDTGAFDYWTQFFVSRGWAVLQINFRGSAGFGREFLTAGFKRWGMEMQDDLTDSAQWLVTQGIADPKRICIVGGSYGGYAALMGIVKTPDLYRCAVSFAGVSDLRDFLQEKKSFIDYEIGWELQLGAWWSDRERLRETSPVNHAGKIRAPLLLLHGTEDRTVPVAQSRDMASALNRAGAKNFQYIELPLGDHHLSREEDRLKMFIEMEQFLKRHLD